MHKRATVIACLALIGMLVASAPTAAHTLEIKRGKKASKKAEPEHCAPADPYCEEYTVENCRRPDGAGHARHWRRHRVDCDITMAGSNDVVDGGPWHCHWTDEWSLRKNSNKLIWSNLVYAQTFDGCPYDTEAA